MAGETNGTTTKALAKARKARSVPRICVGDTVFSRLGDHYGGKVVLIGNCGEVIFRTPEGRLEINAQDDLEIASRASAGLQPAYDVKKRLISVGDVVMCHDAGQTGVVIFASDHAVVLRAFDNGEELVPPSIPWDICMPSYQCEVIPQAMARPEFVI